jgi:hypothetical protein
MIAAFISRWADLTISRCVFIPETYHPMIYPQHPAPIPLGQIDLVMSEVLADLTAAGAKRK